MSTGRHSHISCCATPIKVPKKNKRVVTSGNKTAMIVFFVFFFNDSAVRMWYTSLRESSQLCNCWPSTQFFLKKNRARHTSGGIFYIFNYWQNAICKQLMLSKYAFGLVAKQEKIQRFSVHTGILHPPFKLNTHLVSYLFSLRTSEKRNNCATFFFCKWSAN